MCIRDRRRVRERRRRKRQEESKERGRLKERKRKERREERERARERQMQKLTKYCRYWVWVLVIGVIVVFMGLDLLPLQRIHEEREELRGGTLEELRAMTHTGVQMLLDKIEETQQELRALREAVSSRLQQTTTTKSEDEVSLLKEAEASSVLIPGDTDCCWKHRLLLLSHQRSGTHFFKFLLNLHPKTNSSVELLRNVTMSKHSPIFRNQGYFTRPQLDDYLERTMYNRTVLVVQSNQLLQLKRMKLDLLQLLKEKGYYAVHLLRRDVMRIELSTIVLHLSGQAICYYGGSCSGKSLDKVEMDVTKLVSRLQRIEMEQEANRKMLRSHGFNWVEIDYDQVSSNHTLSCDVLSMMGCGCPPESQERLTQKIGEPKKLRELITNYEQVKRTLTGTKYQEFLDEEDRPKKTEQKSNKTSG
eukprot:TRINITY_DN5104_c0_g1_i1.p1 TRINITY_DN5104_c0_g1~~TRINITY_DN5104_c0_g1_i1.p1  ORF type:complete len:418 (+),score=81.16 TRINITY_DN5104_c0_g1_i1:38-1291(+)